MRSWLGCLLTGAASNRRFMREIPRVDLKGRGLGPFAAGAFARVVILVGRRLAP